MFNPASQSFQYRKENVLGGGKKKKKKAYMEMEVFIISSSHSH